jgi:hypothetical protein
MKLTGSFLFSLLAIAAGSDAKLFGKDKPVYEDWSLDQSIAFLKEQGIKVRDSPTLEEVRKQVLENADLAATVSIIVMDHRAKGKEANVNSGVQVPLVPPRLTSRPSPTRLSTRKFLMP